MRIVSTVKDLTSLLGKYVNINSLGFVPTMGALHSGHISLVAKSLAENNFTICSIFVNPTQFNNRKDLENFPNQLNSDLALLDAAGCDFVFTPSTEEIYPQDFKPRAYKFGVLAEVMEGLNRPGHFNGVAMVVSCLFDLIKPQRAYFGEKDFQQLAVVQSIVTQAKFPIEIVPCATAREKSGLAMSSRNIRLTEHQKKAASQIYIRLSKVSEMAQNRTIEELKSWMKNQFNADQDLELEYFEISKPSSLEPSENLNSTSSHIACIAVFAGTIRLIDNILLKIN